MKLVEEALKEANKLVIVLGSYRAPINLKNPWSYEERVEMITNALPENIRKKVFFVPARDYLYCDLTWLTGVQNATSKVIEPGSSVKIIGHFKDDSSYYLKLFPQWTLIKQPNYFGANSTDIREEFFASGTIKKELLHEPTIKMMEKYEETDRFEENASEHQYLERYKEQWKNSPRVPIFVTTDAVVVQAGHVLLIERGRNPGKGKIALPGGFLQKDKRIIDSCLKELKEETSILFPKDDLRSCLKEMHTFDHPSRDPRGRTLTHAGYFEITKLGPLPKVKGDDDAAGAFWMPISDLALHEPNFFLDHFYILNYFLRGIGR
jgi:bifunctional NMN adenylyltransferase/nudix hydrolase